MDDAAVRRAVAWLAKHLAVARDDLFTAPDVAGHLASLRKGSFPERSGDVLSMVKPFHLLSSDAEGTSHGTPYSYDSQVPVVFVVEGINFGAYLEVMDPVDVAPTVAALMELDMPTSAESKLPAEVLTGK